MGTKPQEKGHNNDSLFHPDLHDLQRSPFPKPCPMVDNSGSVLVAMFSEFRHNVYMIQYAVSVPVVIHWTESYLTSNL